MLRVHVSFLLPRHCVSLAQGLQGSGLGASALSSVSTLVTSLLPVRSSSCLTLHPLCPLLAYTISICLCIE